MKSIWPFLLSIFAAALFLFGGIPSAPPGAARTAFLFLGVLALLLSLILFYRHFSRSRPRETSEEETAFYDELNRRVNQAIAPFFYFIIAITFSYTLFYQSSARLIIMILHLITLLGVFFIEEYQRKKLQSEWEERKRPPRQ